MTHDWVRSVEEGRAGPCGFGAARVRRRHVPGGLRCARARDVGGAGGGRLGRVTTTSAPHAQLLDRLGDLAEIVDTSTLTRALYSSDSSLYRVAPQAVAHPRTTEELISLVRAALDTGTPITARGAGTSCAGNAVGPGLVIDVSRHLNRIHSDRPARPAPPWSSPAWSRSNCRSPPGRTACGFGPDPSTSNRCTVGGMIGNNACGPRALRLRPDGGQRGQPGHHHRDRRAADGLGADDVARRCARWWPANLGRHPHRVRPVHPPGLRLLAGAPAAGAEVRRGEVLRRHRGHARRDRPRDRPPRADAPERLMVALGYPTMADAADDIANLLPLQAHRVRGPGPAHRRRGGRQVAAPPPSRRCPPATAGCSSRWSATTPPRSAPGPRRWRPPRRPSRAGWSTIRPWPRRCGGSARTAPAWRASAWPSPPTAGWEDAAVPPAQLGAYLRDVRRPAGQARPARPPLRPLRRRLRALPHRLPPHRARRRRAVPRRSSRTRPQLVAGYGGSMSGEHGDGRARSALLPHMYSPEALALFARRQAHLRPGGTCSTPACSSTPPPSTPISGWRPPAGRRCRCREPEFVEQVHRCTGVGKCLADTTGAGGVMCPSLPGHPRREGLHPWPGAGAAGDGQRHAGHRGLALPRGARRAGPVPVLQGLLRATARPASTWPPTRPRSPTSATRAGSAPATTTRWAGCRAGVGSSPPSPGWAR